LNCARGSVRKVNIIVMLTLRTLPRAQFNDSTLEVNFAFHKLDALRIMVPSIVACALVVGSNRRLNFLVSSYKNVSSEMRDACCSRRARMPQWMAP